MPQIANAFYKGTSVESPIDDGNMYIRLSIEGAQMQIKCLLKEGYNIQQIKNITIEQLDTMEEGLFVAQQKSKDNGAFVPFNEITSEQYYKYLEDSCFGAMKGYEFAFIWFMNVATLLKLKAIQNDNENGWFIIDKPL